MWEITQYSHECLHNDVSSNAFLVYTCLRLPWDGRCSTRTHRTWLFSVKVLTREYSEKFEATDTLFLMVYRFLTGNVVSNEKYIKVNYLPLET